MSINARALLAAALAAMAFAGPTTAGDSPVFSGHPGSPGIGGASETAGLPSLGIDAPTAADLAAAGVSTRPLGPLGEGLAPGSGVSDPQVILGWDSRMRMNTVNYPNRAIVLIERRIQRTWYQHCTGFMISRDTVATAGHCLHTGGRDGDWYGSANLRVAPGADGDERPYGTCGGVRSHSVVGWTQDRDRRFDYGALRIDCNVGNTVGWFGFYHRAGLNTFINEPAIISGYPGDKSRQQWLSADKVRLPATWRLLYYRMDTTGGHSGSPIWSDRGNALAELGPWAYGIHTFGQPGANRNGGTRILGPVANNLRQWIRRD